MLRLNPFTARKGDNTIVQLYIIPVEKTRWAHKNLLWAKKNKIWLRHVADTVSAKQRTMVKLKAIRSIWKNKHKGSNVNLSHKLSPLPPPTCPNASIVPPLVFLIWPWTISPSTRVCWKQHMLHKVPNQEPNNMCWPWLLYIQNTWG